MIEPQGEVGITWIPAEPDWVVLRAAADLPPGALPAALDGVWIDKPRAMIDLDSSDTPRPFAVFLPTGRFEVRDDGAVAEVFEMRP